MDFRLNKILTAAIAVACVASLSGCETFRNLELKECNAGGNASASSSGGAQIGVQGSCTFGRKQEEEQASIWNRFKSAIFAYTPNTIADVDFSSIEIALPSSGGHITTTTLDIDLSLYDENNNLLTTNSFPGNISDNILKLSSPDDVKGWAQNFEDTAVKFLVNVEGINYTVTADQLTVHINLNAYDTNYASSTVTYSQGRDCIECGSFIIE